MQGRKHEHHLLLPIFAGNTADRVGRDTTSAIRVIR